jgi:heterodisulfide reductase subunit C
MSGKDALSRLQQNLSVLGPEQCNQCGKCSSGCPAARFLDLSPRRVVAMTQYELITEILESKVIWECAQCLQCTERCPREVTPFDIIINLQNLAVSEGLYYPEGLTKMLNSVKRYGLIQPPQEIIDREFETHDRESLNLPEPRSPKDLSRFAAALEKVMEEG